MNDPDTTVLPRLYTEHAGALWRYALRLTGDRAHAEDVVQETLLRAWQHPHLADDNQRSPRPWLFRVARNLIIDEHRSARVRHEVRSRDGSEDVEPCGPDEADAALDRLLINDALNQLSPEHRAVIRRSYHQGLTITQIAHDLHIADGTVKSRLHYARPAAHPARKGRHPVTCTRATATSLWRNRPVTRLLRRIGGRRVDASTTPSTNGPSAH
jgi:RNA polymerase sigma-70 factor (ECF subfamily)